MLYSNQALKKLIIPLIVEQILAIAVGMADTIMISVVGEAAVSGVSLVDTVNVLVINIFSALATGGAVVAGHFLGQKRLKDACSSAWQLILFSGLLSLGVTALFLGAHNWILHTVFGNIDAEVMQNAKTYLIITAFSVFPLAVYNSCAALFRTMNNAKVTMWISVLMNIINFAGNAICIFGLKWGVAGAAIPTTLSRLAGAVIIFIMMFNRSRDINLCGQITLRFDRSRIKRILYVGVPNGLENSMFQLGKILLLSLVSTLGTVSIAANAVANTIATVNCLPGIAISMALLSVVSVCVGAGAFEQARYYTRKLLLFSWVSMCVISVLLFAGAPFLVKMYSLSPETASLTVDVIRFHAVMAGLIWVPSFVLPNTFRGSGYVVWPMFIAILSMWVFRIGFAYLFHNILSIGLMGVWIAMTIDWAFRAACYLVRYRGKKWENEVIKRRE